MGLGLTERVRAGAGTFAEWKRDRDADMARAGADIQARADQLVRKAIRTGQEIAAKTPSEVREFVKAAAVGGLPAAVAATAVNRVARSASSANSQPTRRHPGASAQTRPSRDQQILENARRLEAGVKRAASIALEQAEANGTVRRIAGDAARTIGNLGGLVTGAGQMAKDVADAAILGRRLTDPMDLVWSRPGQSAWDQVAGVWADGARLGKRVVTDPRGVIQDVEAMAAQAGRDLDPSATPAAPTLAGEMRRNFDIGQNQGELFAQVVPYAVGAGEAATAARLAATTRASRISRHIGQRHTPAQAAYLAEPYPASGLGHHSMFRRNAKYPKWLSGGPMPRSIVDSEFSVVKPGASRGEVYEGHAGLDRQFKGARFPRHVGGSWSAKRAGVRDYHGVERLWIGTPTATKRAVAVGGIVPDFLPLDDYDDEALYLR